MLQNLHYKNKNLYKESHKNLDVIEKMVVLNRLDSTIAKLIQIKKDMNERN